MPEWDWNKECYSDEEPVEWSTIFASANSGSGQKYHMPRETTSKFCCTYNDTGTGDTVVGFYIPSDGSHSLQILLPVISQFDPDPDDKVQVLGISQQIFLPVDRFLPVDGEISKWTNDNRRERICSDIESALQGLQIDISTALYDKVADKTARSHREGREGKKDTGLMRTMNSLLENKGREKIGHHSLLFTEGRIEPSLVRKDRAYLQSELEEDMMEQSRRLIRTRATRLPKTLGTCTYGPTTTVHKLVWGSVDLWKPQV